MSRELIAQARAEIGTFERTSVRTARALIEALETMLDAADAAASTLTQVDASTSTQHDALTSTQNQM